MRLLSSVKLIIAISRLILVLWDEGRDPLLVGRELRLPPLPPDDELCWGCRGKDAPRS